MAGTDLSVTDVAMTRFKMLRSEAVALIVRAASTEMGGSIMCRAMPAYVLGDLCAVISEMHGVARRRAPFCSSWRSTS